MIDRIKCKLDNLIGKPFGFKYEIKDQHLYLLQNVINDDEMEKIELTSDNRNLLDNSDVINLPDNLKIILLDIYFFISKLESKIKQR
jgi:hypothetical protein